MAEGEIKCEWNRRQGKWERMIREKRLFYLSTLHLCVLGLAELAYLPFLSFPLVLSLITTEKTRAHEPTAILFSFFFCCYPNLSNRPVMFLLSLSHFHFHFYIRLNLFHVLF